MKKISINLEDYELAAHNWIKQVFKRLHHEPEIYEKFDRAIGLKYINTKDGYKYCFEVLDEKKFLISVLKYSINFITL